MAKPWEIVSADTLPEFVDSLSGKGVRVSINDRLSPDCVLKCCSATDLEGCPDVSFDVVVTDPPFGGLLHYSELSDFFTFGFASF